MRVGLLGGTFNPIHTCHLVVAEQTQERLLLDEVMFIPTGDPPHKPSHSLAPSHHRLTMVQLATADFKNFSVSTIESHSTQKCYTIDTLKQLRQDHSPETEFFFIIGLDAFLELPSWKDATQVLTLANFVVISRPNTRFSDLTALYLLPPLPQSSLQDLDTGVLTRSDTTTSKMTSLILLGLPPCEISSSAVRHRLMLGLPLDDWLPPSVESYIIEHKLYDAHTA